MRQYKTKIRYSFVAEITVNAENMAEAEKIAIKGITARCKYSHDETLDSIKSWYSYLTPEPKIVLATRLIKIFND